MTRIMYDACNPDHIPGDARMVAGYKTGSNCAWPVSAWSRFPHAVKVRISTNSRDTDADVLDVERGAALVSDAPGWAAKRRFLRGVPTIYCNASTWPAVINAFRAQQVAPPLYWIAVWDGQPDIPVGAIAHQYLTESPPGCDTSVVADYWPGVDPLPVPPPPHPIPQEASAVFIAFVNPPTPPATEYPGTTQTWPGYYLKDGSAYDHIVDTYDLADIESKYQGIPVITVDIAQHNAWVAGSSAATTAAIKELAAALGHPIT